MENTNKIKKKYSQLNFAPPQNACLSNNRFQSNPEPDTDLVLCGSSAAVLHPFPDA